MATLEELMAEKQRRMGAGQPPELDALMAEKQRRAEQPVEKQVPSFMKKLDMINTGVDRGVKNFTLALLSKIPGGDTYQNAIKQVDAQSTAEQELNKATYSGYYPQAGEIAGEVLATAPLGAPMGGVAKLAAGASKAIPGVLGTAAKYAISGAGGAGVLAGMESQRYDPENPGQLINQEAAGKALSNPLSYALPMAGTAIGNWADKAKAVGEASDVLGQQAIPRNVMEKGAKKSLYQSIFGIIPALTQSGAQVQELEHIGGPIWNFVKKTADMADAKNASDVIQKAGKTLQNTIKQVKSSVNEAWDKPFKMQPVKDTAGVISDAKEAIQIIDNISTAIPQASLFKQSINRQIDKASKGPLTIEDVKNIHSNLGSAISKIKAVAGANEISTEMGDIRDRLTSHMGNSLSADDLADLNAAKEQSRLFYDLKSTSPLIEKAMRSEVDSRNLVRKLISDKEPINKQRVLDELSPAGQQQVAATKIADVWRQSNKSQGFDIDGFVTKVQNDPGLSGMLGGDTYKSLEGLNTYLKSVSEGAKTSGWNKFGVAAAVGVPAALSGIGPGAAAGALASLAAMTYVSNHPVLKNIFYGLSKKLPEGTKNLLEKSVGRHLSRAGYLIDQNGVLQHKTEQAQ